MAYDDRWLRDDIRSLTQAVSGLNISLRDRFAMSAMSAIQNRYSHPIDVATAAYKLADAMIVVRKNDVPM
jgi:hypothetical protein